MQLMPPSFPTIRLSQLAMLYHLQPNLFSKILIPKNIQELKSLFENIKLQILGKSLYVLENFRKKIEKLSTIS